MDARVVLLAGLLALSAVGCASHPAADKRQFWGFDKCDPLESGYAWCESRARMKRG